LIEFEHAVFAVLFLNEGRAAAGFVAKKGNARSIMCTLADSDNRIGAATFFALNLVTIKRNRNALVFQIGGRLDDFSAVVGCVSKPSDLSAVGVSHDF
jgi:hypothetical protein